MADPVYFVVKKLPYDLSSHGGLALVGRLFKRINLVAMVDPKYPDLGGIANSDILKCYLVGSDLFIFKQRPVRQHPASAGCQGHGGLISTTLQS